MYTVEAGRVIKSLTLKNTWEYWAVTRKFYCLWYVADGDVYRGFLWSWLLSCPQRFLNLLISIICVMQINQRRFKGHFVSHLSNVVDEMENSIRALHIYIICTLYMWFFGKRFEFQNNISVGTWRWIFSCNKKVYPPLQCFSPLQRQVSVIVIVGYLDQPMDNKNWTKHRKQCTQYLIESPVCILAGPTPSDLNEIFTQVCLQILIYR